MKIGVQAMFMVFSPLILGLAIIAAFYVLLDNTKQDLIRVHKAKEFVAASDRVLAALAKGAVTSVLYNATGDEEFAVSHHKAEKEAAAGVKSLKAIAGDDQERMRLVRIFGKATVQTLTGQQMVMRATGFESTGQLFRPAPGQDLSMSRLRPPSETPQERLIKVDAAIANRAPTIHKETRERVQIVLIFAALAELLLAVLLALVFNRKIARRIQSVLENTSRLKSRQALKEPLHGEDELALLDHVFYNSARQIIENENFKQQLIGIASHDLRTPLSSIKLTLATISEGAFGELNADASKRVRMASLSLDRLIRLVNDLLDAERLSAGKFTLNIASCQTKLLFDSAVAAVEDIASRKNIQITKLFPETDVFCDYDRMVQVLVNLLGNAIKFSEPGGKIELAASVLGEELEIKVSDNGRGIPEDKLDKLFGRFEQVEYKDASEKGGSGLGLAISKAIMDQHGGGIEVSSVYGSGSTFCLRFPGLVQEKVKANAK